MKRTIFVMLTLVCLGLATGCLGRHCRHNACQSGNCPQGEVGQGTPCPSGACPVDPGNHHCRLCGDRGCERCRGPQMAQPGPATGAVAYPYYTLRGPRDFLERNPQPIGP